MPSRVVRGEIIKSKSLSRVSELAEAMFVRLLSVVDDFGRYDGDAEILAAHLYPRRESASEGVVEARLQELVNADGPGKGPVELYEIDGNRYLRLVNWEKHRGKSRRGDKSKWPSPPTSGRSGPETQPTASPEIRGDPRGPSATHGDPPGESGSRGVGEK